MKTTYEPGIYPDMSNEDYHAGPGISKSGISLILDCPLKYKSRYIDLISEEPTQAMVVGSATHTAVLEPDLFDAQFAVAPLCDRRTKAGKETYAAFVNDAAGKGILSFEEYAMVASTRDAVRSHPMAGKIVKSPGGMVEHSLFADHPSTGLLTKVRPDLLLNTRGLIVDLKTAVSAGRDEFERAAWNYTYHIQAGMYLSVAQDLGFDVGGFLFIVVEKKAPYTVAVYLADRDMIELGKREFERGMGIYSNCLEHNSWKGYNDDAAVTVGLKPWAIRTIEEAQNV